MLLPGLAFTHRLSVAVGKQRRAWLRWLAVAQGGGGKWGQGKGVGICMFGFTLEPPPSHAGGVSVLRVHMLNGVGRKVARMLQAACCQPCAIQAASMGSHEGPYDPHLHYEVALHMNLCCVLRCSCSQLQVGAVLGTG
jgi:hypothetical protein